MSKLFSDSGFEQIFEPKPDTATVYRNIVVALAQNYAYLHQYYGNPNEEAMAEKIAELAQKICSKI